MATKDTIEIDVNVGEGVKSLTAGVCDQNATTGTAFFITKDFLDQPTYISIFTKSDLLT